MSLSVFAVVEVNVLLGRYDRAEFNKARYATGVSLVDRRSDEDSFIV